MTKVENCGNRDKCFFLSPQQQYVEKFRQKQDLT